MVQMQIANTMMATPNNTKNITMAMAKLLIPEIWVVKNGSVPARKKKQGNR